ERAVAELEVELGGLDGSNPLALDALAHAADLDHSIDRDAVRRVGEVAGRECEPLAERLVAGDGAGGEHRLELPGLRVALPVLEETGHRTGERTVAAFGPEVGVDLPARVAHV